MQCITPYFRKDTGMSFPCGKCAYCKKRRISGWSFRLTQFIKKEPLASFVTLTYNTDHLPFTKRGFMTLQPNDITLFLKRLRINQQRHNEKLLEKNYKTKYYGKKISYYVAGEYGSRFGRPHYHLILFNADPNQVLNAWTDDKKMPLGSIYFGTATPASVGYTLKYMSKDSKIPVHRNDDRVPEFQRMSKGIGENYLTPQMINWHLQDLFGRSYVNVGAGIKVAMPRYYKDRIYTPLERIMIGEAMQSKTLETEWSDVNSLLNTNSGEYFRLKYDHLRIESEKQKLKVLQNDRF